MEEEEYIDLNENDENKPFLETKSFLSCSTNDNFFVNNKNDFLNKQKIGNNLKLKKIEDEYSIVNDIYSDMNNILKDQNEILITVDSKIDNINYNTLKGVKELKDCTYEGNISLSVKTFIFSIFMMIFFGLVLFF